MLRASCPMPPPPPHPSANQQLTFAEALDCLVYLIIFLQLSGSLCSVVVRVLDSHPRERRFASRDQQDLFSAFEREGGGDGWRAGTRGEGQARRAGTKYF
jgi:hypothetical protein